MHRLGVQGAQFREQGKGTGAKEFVHGRENGTSPTAILSLVVLAIALRRLLVNVLCDDSNPIMVCTLALACASDDRGRLGSILGDGRADSLGRNCGAS